MPLMESPQTKIGSLSKSTTISKNILAKLDLLILSGKNLISKWHPIQSYDSLLFENHEWDKDDNWPQILLDFFAENFEKSKVNSNEMLLLDNSTTELDSTVANLSLEYCLEMHRDEKLNVYSSMEIGNQAYPSLGIGYFEITTEPITNIVSVNAGTRTSWELDMISNQLHVWHNLENTPQPSAGVVYNSFILWEPNTMDLPMFWSFLPPCWPYKKQSKKFQIVAWEKYLVRAQVEFQTTEFQTTEFQTTEFQTTEFQTKTVEFEITPTTFWVNCATVQELFAIFEPSIWCSSWVFWLNEKIYVTDWGKLKILKTSKLNNGILLERLSSRIA